MDQIVVISLSFALLVVFCGTFVPDALAKKHKQDTTNNFMVKGSDPLWAQYAYAGKKQLERLDIAQAQRYFWAAALELQALAKTSPNTKINDLGDDVLDDTLAVSNDVFFQDPRANQIKTDPPSYDVAISPDYAAQITQIQQKLTDDQIAFDKAHPRFDGGARLRMVHLRQRIEFLQRVQPSLKTVLGADDSLTKQASELLEGDTGEFTDLQTQN